MQQKHIFVPLAEEMIEKHPKLFQGKLVPYQTDIACCHWLSVEIIQPEVDIKNTH